MSKNDVKKSFMLFNDWKEVFDGLTDEQAGQLIKAIFAHEAGEDCPLSGLLYTVFVQIRQQLDRNREAYKEKCEKNRKNGNLGGRPPKKRIDNSTAQNNRTVINGNPIEPPEPDTDTETAKEKDTDIDMGISVVVTTTSSSMSLDDSLLNRQIDGIGDLAVQEYIKCFGELTEQKERSLRKMAKEYGDFVVYRAVGIAYSMDTIPDNLMAYIRGISEKLEPYDPDANMTNSMYCVS